MKDIYKLHFNSVFYIQNNSDYFHLKNHCHPFLETLTVDKIHENKDCLINDSFYFKSAYWGDGHVGPPPAYWKMLIDYLVNYSGDREAIFTSKEFTFFLAKANDAYIADLEERIILYFDKGDYDKSSSLVDRYFKSVIKPTAEMCLLALKVFFKLGDMAKIKVFYDRSKLQYPDGWALVYYYSVYVSKLGYFNEAIEELEELQVSFKEKMPPPAHDLLLKLKKSCV